MFPKKTAKANSRSIGMRMAAGSVRRPTVWFSIVNIVRLCEKFASAVCDCDILAYVLASISNGLGRRQVPNLVRSGRKQP